MQTNAIPKYDMSDNPTNCCPRFNPEGWDNASLHFRDKPFIRATTRSLFHIPINMGAVFSRVQDHMEDEEAFDEDDYIVLSRDISASKGEHFFSVNKSVPGEEMTMLSGDFFTKVFEGPYRQAKDWYTELEEETRARGSEPKRIFFFYTTCPKCAKSYGKNYVVGVSEL